MVKFYHYLFFRMSRYYKDKDLPVFSPVIGMSAFFIINYATVFHSISYFVYHSRWTTKLDYWIPLAFIFAINYWYFHQHDRWKKIIEWGDSLPKDERRQNNIIYLIYAVLSVSSFVFSMYMLKENIFRYY